MKKIKILLVDIFYSQKSGIIPFLVRNNYKVITSNDKEFLNSYKEQKPDVVIFQLKELDYRKISIIKDAIKIFPEIKIITFLSKDSNELNNEVASINITNIVNKKEGLKALLREILSLTNNNSNNSLGKILLKEKSISSISRRTQRSEIEKKILLLICKGFSSREIAHKLNKSARAIDGHRSEMLEKTESKNIVQLAIYAIKTGIVKLEDLDPIPPK